MSAHLDEDDYDSSEDHDWKAESDDDSDDGEYVAGSEDDEDLEDEEKSKESSNFGKTEKTPGNFTEGYLRQRDFANPFLFCSLCLNIVVTCKPPLAAARLNKIIFAKKTVDDASDNVSHRLFTDYIGASADSVLAPPRANRLSSQFAKAYFTEGYLRQQREQGKQVLAAVNGRKRGPRRIGRTALHRRQTTLAQRTPLQQRQTSSAPQATFGQASQAQSAPVQLQQI
ncbi:hypothetical protein L596_007295 [Steinernema carpocapsae]|nr:hypothetical protein L596_007295 [Steinernema carpocapsae]